MPDSGTYDPHVIDFDKMAKERESKEKEADARIAAERILLGTNTTRYLGSEATKKADELLRKEMQLLIQSSSLKNKYDADTWAKAGDRAREYYKKLAEMHRAAGRDEEAQEVEKFGKRAVLAADEKVKAAAQADAEEAAKKSFGIAKGMAGMVSPAGGMISGQTSVFQGAAQVGASVAQVGDNLGKMGGAAKTAGGTLAVLAAIAGSVAEVLDAKAQLNKEALDTIMPLAGMFHLSGESMTEMVKDVLADQAQMMQKFGAAGADFLDVWKALAEGQFLPMFGDDLRGAQGTLSLFSKATLMVANGMGVSSQELASTMVDLRARFSMLSDSSFGFLGVLDQLRQNTQLPFSVVKEVTFSLAANLRQFGYTIEDAAMLTDKFGKALYEGVIKSEDVINMLTGQQRQKPSPMMYFMSRLGAGEGGERLQNWYKSNAEGKGIFEQIGEGLKLAQGPAALAGEWRKFQYESVDKMFGMQGRNQAGKAGLAAVGGYEAFGLPTLQPWQMTGEGMEDFWKNLNQTGIEADRAAISLKDYHPKMDTSVKLFGDSAGRLAELMYSGADAMGQMAGITKIFIGLIRDAFGITGKKGLGLSSPSWDSRNPPHYDFEGKRDSPASPAAVRLIGQQPLQPSVWEFPYR